MAVLEYRELWDGRGGTGSWPNKRVYTRVFQVRTSLAAEASNTVVNVIGIRQGSRHPEDLFAYCVRIDPRQEADDPTLWKVTYEYDSHPDLPTGEAPDPQTGDAPEPKQNPLLKPAVWKYGFEKVTKAVAEEFTSGDPILNSAGLPFDPPITVERSRPTISLTLNRPYFNADLAALYVDAVNDKPWRGRAARTWRVTAVDAQTGFENGVSYATVTYTFGIEYPNWDVRILDAGYCRKVVSATPPSGPRPPDRWERIKDAFGQDITEPVPLDGNGQPLAPGANPVFLTFRVYPERDFSQLFF